MATLCPVCSDAADVTIGELTAKGSPPREIAARVGLTLGNIEQRLFWMRKAAATQQTVREFKASAKAGRRAVAKARREALAPPKVAPERKPKPKRVAVPKPPRVPKAVVLKQVIVPDIKPRAVAMPTCLWCLAWDPSEFEREMHTCRRVSAQKLACADAA